MPCARATPAVMKHPRIAVAIRIENLGFHIIVTLAGGWRTVFDS
jgi:hypothetical protein